jgi:hypothetical protein
MNPLMTDFVVHVILSIANVGLAFAAGWWFCQRSHRGRTDIRVEVRPAR